MTTPRRELCSPLILGLLGNNLYRCAVRADDGFIQAEPHISKRSTPLTIPSFPKTPNEWGFAGTRYQGPNRASSFQGASSYEEHIEQSAEMPFPMETGFHILLEDVQAAISSHPSRGCSTKGPRAHANSSAVKSNSGDLEGGLAGQDPGSVDQGTLGEKWNGGARNGVTNS